MEVLQADVTTLDVDAIANAANTRLLHGGGAAGAISRAGGPAIQAESNAKAPIALVPTNDPMTLVNDKPSVAKTNLYRAGVDQPALAAGADTGRAYCRMMVAVQQARLRRDRALFRAAPSPDAGTSLYTFLVQRLHASYDSLGCAALLGRPNPIPATAA